MTFSEFTNAMLELVLFIVLPAVVLLAKTEGKKFVDGYIAKIENDKIKEYVNFATVAVGDAVSSVSQTFVDNLKEQGNFNKESMETAFFVAKKKALEVISDEAKEAIKLVYNDVDKWLDSAIESAVKAQKGLKS